MEMLSQLDAINWSPAATSVWGKTNAFEIRARRARGEADDLPAEWLPLVQHLQDTAGVAAHLFDRLPRLIKQDITDSFGHGEESARAFVSLIAGIHDLGKVSAGFTRMAVADGSDMPDLITRMESQGFRFPSRLDHVWHHTLVGQVAVRAMLKQLTSDRAVHADAFASLIGAHHGTNPSKDALKACETDLRIIESGCPVWGEVRSEIFTKMARAVGAETWLSQWVTSWQLSTALPLIEGLIIQADWIASDTWLFPLGEPEPTSVRVEHGVRRLDLPPAWVPTGLPGDDFANLGERFQALEGLHPNALQSAALHAAKTAHEAPLMIIEAPMGGGKTEAALLAAEVLDARFGCGGIFFGLPTMATANPMFTRVAEWLAAVPVASASALVLSHSKAGLNDDFQQLQQETYGAGRRGAVVRVDSWFLQSKRGILANTVVGTIDQSLFMALQAKHVVLRHLGLAGKVVIIDEVHAADSYMRVYLTRVLRWLGAYGTPVILLSATLPPATRQELVDAYVRGRTRKQRQHLVSAPVAAYPLITLASSDVTWVSIDQPSAQTTVQIHQLENAESDGIIRLLDEKLIDGGIAGVIVNTVQRAQDIYEELADAFGPDQVRLLHSRFLAPERARKERELVELLGRDGRARPDKLIVVGTQVLEQSLDIDFDVLVTDLAPIDLVLQRMGRLHRHSRHRPPRLAEATCYVAGASTWNGETPPDFLSGSKAIYGSAALLRASFVLGKLDAGRITLPSDIPHLVAQGYADTIDVPDGWVPEFEMAEEQRVKDTAQTQEKAEDFLLKTPGRSSTLTGFTPQQAQDPEKRDDGVQGRAVVRDSEDSLEVIVLLHGADGLIRIPHPHGEGTVVPSPLTDSAVDRDIARQVAASTVVLPRVLSGGWVIDRVIDELENLSEGLGNMVAGWQRSYWLKGQLVLFLDDTLNARLAGMSVHYDYEKGLQVTKDDPSASGTSATPEGDAQ